MRTRPILVAAWIVLGACDSAGDVVLVVDLKTDYVPGRQFYGVRTEVGPADLASVAERVDRIASRSDDYFAGQRVAELHSLAQGTMAVRVTLLDGDGEPLASRVTIVTLTRQHSLTVLVTSACERISCPGPGDDPSFSACVGGRCVDPRCSPQNPTACGLLGCTADTDCPSPVSCGDGLCVDSECFVRVVDARCGTGACDPRSGCVEAPPDPDAGTPCPARETACTDGMDEDCDGAVDCEDPDCAGARCDDGSACTEGDWCTDGTCAGTPIACDDGNHCTDDSCDPALGCVHAPNDAGCDDGDACTQGDVCAGGACAGTPVVCDDGNPCTDDVCDPAAGCTFPNNMADCDDGFWCNGPDRCAAGACTAVGPPACPAFCNEMSRTCASCLTDADCGAVTYGTWGGCGGFVEPCGQTGTQSRSVMTPRCMGGSCSVVSSSESRSCSRSTTGMTCRTTTYTAWGACNYSDACDQSASQSRTRTDYRCASGSCGGTNTTETRSCSRTVANGTSCGGTWLRCCSGVCRDLRTNSYCGACGVNCSSIGRSCAATGTGGYSCRSCTTNAECQSILNGSATCWNDGSAAFCNCQCPSNGVCANAGCGTNMYCHDCPGQNFCAPFGGSC